MAEDRKLSTLALKIGVASAIGIAAVGTGLVMSRRGRHLLREAWEGRWRTRLEDRVLDALWGDPVFGRRRLDVEEVGEGTILLTGEVRTRGERKRAEAMAASVKGVAEVVNQLAVVGQSRRS